MPDLIPLPYDAGAASRNFQLLCCAVLTSQERAPWSGMQLFNGYPICSCISFQVALLFS